MDRRSVWMTVLLAVSAVALATFFGWKNVLNKPSATSQMMDFSQSARSSVQNDDRGIAATEPRPARGQKLTVVSEGHSSQPAPPTKKQDDVDSASASSETAADATASKDSTPSIKEAATPAASRESSALPAFDVVQVDENGHVVLAGRARPGATVVVLVDGRVVGTTDVDAQGAWAFDTDDEPPLHDTHQLTIRVEDEAGNVLAHARQTVLISMKPVEEGGLPLVVLSSPDAPSRVLQKPSVKRIVRADRTLRQDINVLQDEANATPTGNSAENVSDRDEQRRETDASLPMAAQPEQVRQESAAARRAGTEQLAAAARIFERHLTRRDTAPVSMFATGEPAGAAATEQQSALMVEVVDYDSNGAIFFTGRSSAGAVLRLYVNNRHLGDVRADAEGTWQWRGRAGIIPGKHILRVDVLAVDGRVLQRMELPFVQADARQLARAGKVGAAMGTVTGNAHARDMSDKANMHDAGLDTEESTTGSGMPGDGAVPPASHTDDTMEDGQGKQAASGERQIPSRGFVVVQPGNNLWNIARVIYGKGVRYTTIYEANRDRIRDPNRIYPGQVFAAPGLPEGKLSIDPRRRQPATPEELQQSGTLH